MKSLCLVAVVFFTFAVRADELSWAQKLNCNNQIKQMKSGGLTPPVADCKTTDDLRKVESALDPANQTTTTGAARSGAAAQVQAPDVVPQTHRDPTRIYCHVVASGFIKETKVASAAECDSFAKTEFCAANPGPDRPAGYDITLFRGDDIVSFAQHKAAEANCPAPAAEKAQKGVCRYGPNSVGRSLYPVDQLGADACARDVAAGFTSHSRELSEDCAFTSENLAKNQMTFQVRLPVNINGKTFEGHASGPCPKPRAASESSLPASINNAPGGNSR